MTTPSQSQSLRPRLSLEFTKVHKNHGITHSKADSKDLLDVFYTRKQNAGGGNTSLTLRFAAKPDGTIPKEILHYETEGLAREALDILRKTVKRNITSTMPQKGFDTRPKTDSGLRQTLSAQKTLEDPVAGLRRFLG